MIDKSAKHIFMAVGSVLLLIIAISATFVIYSQPASGENIIAVTPESCQYPARPLVDGQCDNSDPACPETIKWDGGNCTAPESLENDVVAPAPNHDGSSEKVERSCVE